MDLHAKAVAQAVKAGVKIAMGTDSGVFAHGQNIEELTLMRQAGMTSGAALAASTSQAAELLEFPDRGRISAGLRADLVVAQGDPYDFPTHQKRLALVFKKGRAVRRSR